MIWSIDGYINSAWRVLYYPNAHADAYNITLTEELNDAGSLTFTLPPTNLYYSSIVEGATKVRVNCDNRPYWYGYVVSTNKNRNKELKCECVGELSYLTNTIQPQARYQGMSPTALFKKYLEYHNEQSEEKFLPGRVTVTDPNDSVYRYTNYETSLKALRDDLCDSFNGYLKIRHIGNKRYLDLLTINTYGNLSNQMIEFGSNLLDYAENTTALDLATACLPLGKKLDTQEVNGLDAYTTIKSVNNGLDYVENATAKATYGMRKQVVKWDDVTVPSTLKTKAEAWLTSNQYSTVSLTVKALDLSVLNVLEHPKRWYDYGSSTYWNTLGDDDWDAITGSWNDLGSAEVWSVLDGVKFEDLNHIEGNVDAFRLGDRVRCFATPYGMNTTFPIYKKTTNLQDPTQTTITLSASGIKTFTQMTSQQFTNVAWNIPAVASEVGTIVLATDGDGLPIGTVVNGNVYKNGAQTWGTLIVNGTWSSGDTLFTIQNGFRPSIEQKVLGTIGGTSIVFTIPTTGIVTAPSAVSAANVQISLMY